MIQDYWLPTIRAAIQLDRGNAQKALDLLQPTSSFELGQPNQFQLGTMYPVYVRGLAYLLKGQGQQAAYEFQKMVDHRGLLLNFPLGALARLQIGRARALIGDKGSAKAAYDEFLALWKNADSDIPVLEAAKKEYAKFH
jgi:hypothetical protein